MSDAREEYIAAVKHHERAIIAETGSLSDLESAFRHWCKSVRNTVLTALLTYEKAQAVGVESQSQADKLATLILDMKAELDRLSALHPKPTEIE
jgi:hypothetical protein